MAQNSCNRCGYVQDEPVVDEVVVSNDIVTSDDTVRDFIRSIKRGDHL